MLTVLGGCGTRALTEIADPCFGTVVEGIEAVDLLFHHGLNQKQNEGKEHPWTMNTRIIVKIEIM
jgi:hypothetical protein